MRVGFFLGASVELAFLRLLLKRLCHFCREKLLPFLERVDRDEDS